ncbi:SIMPL domain-containing protein [Lutimonas zeaxanthinifaciens]|uniref:SIMPL domain-containing protein n=1 Tax=Lutimonas zeaxanthinifaciens TaxID=3060215 RepID=UPI00265D0CAE|nr:SIMPL domain-containing protein [Lutimonas sp. YSD2104]WKK65368.1 SIMPL domain-containing protein [Lutimonas sp. YSD2104]
MKNNLIIPALLIGFGLIVSGYFIGNTHKKAIEHNRYVQVKGLSEREVQADLAVWPINTILTGNDLKSLKTEIENQNKKVYQFFLDQGFTDGELTKGMTNITDAKSNIFNNNPSVGFRYLAKSEFTVRTKDIKKLQKALAESLNLMSAGIVLGSKNEWRPIEYIFTGLNDLKPSMIEEATTNARQVAEKFARDSNSQVGPIKMARQGQFSINDRDQNTPEIKIIRVVSTIDFQLIN